MAKLDPFTAKRLERFVEDFRQKGGQLPTLKDLREGGFPESTVDQALKDQLLEMFYVTLTSGSVVKGYKLKS